MMKPIERFQALLNGKRLRQSHWIDAAQDGEFIAASRELMPKLADVYKGVLELWACRCGGACGAPVCKAIVAINPSSKKPWSASLQSRPAQRSEDANNPSA